MLRIECENTYIEQQDIVHAHELSEGCYVVISISDNGVGMEHGTIERAVEPFFTTKGVGQGSGLGLSMVSGLAQQFGGAIIIDSQTGLGTTVKIYLPQYANVEVFQSDLEPKVDFPNASTARADIHIAEELSFFLHRRKAAWSPLCEFGFPSACARSVENAASA